MRKSIYICLFVFIFGDYGYADSYNLSQIEQIALSDLPKLVNYSKLNPVDSADFIRQRIAQLVVQQTLGIPKRLQIPAELMAYRKKGASNYFIKYNVGKNTAIAYVPSDLVEDYEIEAWKDFQKHGNNSPLLSIILAQQFTESHFNPKLTGDGGKSCGLPQLHRPTAKWLSKVDSETWDKLIYWDKQGKHHFLSIEAQIKFPYIFLPQYKKYSSATIFEGLRRYNGTGANARNYAQLVIKRSLRYLELMQQYNLFQEDSSKIEPTLFLIVNMALFNKGLQNIEQHEFTAIFNQIKMEFSSVLNNFQLQNDLFLGNPETGRKHISLSANYQVPADGRKYYIVIEEGRTLFSYFHKTNEMLRVLTYYLNRDFFCYYWYRGRKVIISSPAAIKGHSIFSNTESGDHIFIPPGTKIYSPDTDLVTEIKS